MREELESLLDELEAVKACPLDYLPQYGYSPKEEVMQLIEEDIRELEEEMKEAEEASYDDDELEDERRALCLSQGLARWC